MSVWNILFVDDEPHILSSIRRSMNDTPYNVFFATSANEGLELLKRQMIHMVITDHQMPKMNGSEFLHRVRNYDPRIIRCLLSGYTDLETLLNAINRGEVFRFIPKPWEEETLLRIVKECISEYQVRLGEAMLQASIRQVNVPFLVGIPSDSAITWMNPAARELLLDKGASLPDYEDIGTEPDAIPWPLKTLVPSTDLNLHDYMTGTSHGWQGRQGTFAVVAPKGFTDQLLTAYLWKEKL